MNQKKNGKRKICYQIKGVSCCVVEDPQFCPSTLTFILWGVTCTHHSHMAPLGPLLGLVGVRASCGLVCGPLWCVCGSFWRVIVTIFLVVHITLQEGSGVIPMFQLSWSLQGHVEVRSTRACFDHISLFRTRNCTPFFFMDS